MARPFLADPFFLSKASAGEAERINTCIACNQAGLDHTFQARRASCLVNPRAGYETELHLDAPAATAERIAVVGGGPAGLAFSTTAARRGHDVTLFESSATVGGRFRRCARVRCSSIRRRASSASCCMATSPSSSSSGNISEC